MLLIFFIIKFLSPCLLVCNPWRHAFPDHTLAELLFNLIRNPHGYQVHFALLNHAWIQNIIWTERFRHHPQNIGAGHTFLSFIPSTWNSNLKILDTTDLQQIHGTVKSSIELLLTVWPKQSVTQLGWISVLISCQPQLKNRNLKKHFLFHENPIFQNKFRINIKIVINLILNPLLMVFIKFHNVKQKKISNVAFKFKQTLFFSIFNHSEQVKTLLQYVHNQSSQMFSFFIFFPSMHCLFS